MKTHTETGPPLCIPVASPLPPDGARALGVTNAPPPLPPREYAPPPPPPERGVLGVGVFAPVPPAPPRPSSRKALRTAAYLGQLWRRNVCLELSIGRYVLETLKLRAQNTLQASWSQIHYLFANTCDHGIVESCYLSTVNLAIVAIAIPPSTFERHAK